MSRNAASRYCRLCGARLAGDEARAECATCRERAEDLVSGPPGVPAEFWTLDRMRDALASWHMGRVIAAYRTHPFHGRPLSQELVGGWVGLTQAQLSRIETSQPIKDLDRLSLWARTLRIPRQLLWFKLPQNRAIAAGDGAEPSLGGKPVKPSARFATSDQGARPEPRLDVPRTLPPALPDFTGRVAECAALAVALRRAELPRWVLVSGQAGLGKTALAVRIAHEVADLFPDGQLFVRLRRPDGTAVPPEVALGRLLGVLGYRGAAVPQDLDERSALFRSAVVGRRLLVVLDDVVDEAQARWLLPGTPSCAVLMTSRSRLAGVEGVERPSLEPLAVEESRSVLIRVVGEKRVDAESQATRQLVELCAGLPLALRIVAARLASRPEWSLEHMTHLLADERRRLDWLRVGDLEVRASLMLSYEHLSPDQRRLFRLLGVLNAPDFPGWVASALTDEASASAEHSLDRLADIHLVEVIRVGDGEPRYRLHPLVRLLAAELAEAHDPAGDRQLALARVVGGYLVAADAAAQRIPRRFVFDDLPNDCWQPADELLTAARRDPVSWFTDEQAALRSVIVQAGDRHYLPPAWLLLQRFASSLDLRHDLDTIERLSTHLMPAVCAAADLRGEAVLARLQCHGLGYRDQFEDIPRLAGRALEIRRELCHRSGEVEAQRILGEAFLKLGSVQEGRRELEAALALARQVADRLGTAHVLESLACNSTERRSVPAALATLAQALTEARAAGAGTGQILRAIGALLATDGRPGEAVRYLRDALKELTKWSDHWRAATVQIILAGALIDLGELAEADELVRVGHGAILDHHDLYGDGVALAVRSRLAGANGNVDLARAFEDQARDRWRRLPVPPRGVITRSYSRLDSGPLLAEQPEARLVEGAATEVSARIADRPRQRAAQAP